MPAPINSAAATTAIAALLRQALADRLQPKHTGRKSTDAQAPKRSAASASLMSIVLQRAQGLHPDAADINAQILRLLVEASLLQEFGHKLLNAPRFQGMVDQVLHELQSSQALQSDVTKVLEGLKSGQW